MITSIHKKTWQALHNICCDLRAHLEQKFRQKLSYIYIYLNLVTHTNMWSGHPSIIKIDDFVLPEISNIERLFDSSLESMSHENQF
jgi:hypothetical protein